MPRGFLASLKTSSLGEGHLEKVSALLLDLTAVNVKPIQVCIDA